MARMIRDGSGRSMAVSQRAESAGATAVEGQPVRSDVGAPLTDTINPSLHVDETGGTRSLLGPQPSEGTQILKSNWERAGARPIPSGIE